MNKENKIHWKCLSTCKVNDEVWFLDIGNYGLFCLNTQDFSIKYMHSIPFLRSESMLLPYYAGSCFYDGENCIFFPNNCNHILVYHVKKQKMQEVEICSKDGSNIFTTAGIVTAGKQIWVFPHNLRQGIWILDLESLQIRQDKQLQDALTGINDITRMIHQDGIKSWCLSEENKIYEIDIEKKEKNILKQFAGMNICTIRFDGNSYWLLQTDSTDVYEWNQDGKLVKYQLKNAEWITNEGIPYNNIIFLNNKILLLNYRLKYIMEIDQTKLIIDKAFDYPKGFRFIRNSYFESWTAHYAFDIVGDKVLIYPVFGNMLLIYDIKNGSVEGVETNLLMENAEQIAIGANKIYYEYEELCDLHNLLGFEKSMEINKKEEINFGKKIHMECMM